MTGQYQQAETKLPLHAVGHTYCQSEEWRGSAWMCNCWYNQYMVVSVLLYQSSPRTCTTRDAQLWLASTAFVLHSISWMDSTPNPYGTDISSAKWITVVSLLCKALRWGVQWGLSAYFLPQGHPVNLFIPVLSLTRCSTTKCPQLRFWQSVFHSYCCCSCCCRSLRSMINHIGPVYSDYGITLAVIIFDLALIVAIDP